MFEEKNVVEIFGIKGEKGSGKDTFASMVIDRNSKFKVLRFADDLKEMCAEVFGFPLEHSHDPVFKELPLPQPVEMDNFIEEMSIITGLNIKPHNKVAKTIREILQYFGTEYVRSEQDDYWIARVVEKIKKHKSKILVTDCRFPNEAEALRMLGAVIVEILRTDRGQGTDGHASEQQMKEIVPDVTLATRTGHFYLQEAAATLIAEGKSHKLIRYDQTVVNEMLAAYKAGESLADCNAIMGLNEHQRIDIISLVQYHNIPLRPQDT